MAKDEKAPPAKAEAKPDAAAAAAGAAPKKKLPIKAAIIVVALLGMEGGGLYAVLSMTGKPRVSAASEPETEAEGEHGEPAKKDAGDGHGDAKKAEGGHGEKKKDDGHGGGEKKKEEAGGHGGEKKKEAAGGHGGKEEGGKGAPHDPAETVEILVAKDRFPNNHTGRTWLWDAEIHVQVKGKNADRINGILTGRAAEVKTGLAKIWRTAQHNHFNEPGLETLTRQVSEFLDSVLGTTADGKSFIDRVLIPRCVGYPTEY